MASPLSVSRHDAAHHLARAQTRFQEAKTTARMGSYGALSLIVAVLVIALAQGFVWYFTLVCLAAVGLRAVTQRRCDRLERQLWWHQARTGLVDALAEQKHQRAMSSAIDLRDPNQADHRGRATSQAGQ